jgi:hypothetical protein
MRRLHLLAAASVLSATPLAAQNAPAEAPPRIAASSFATVEVHLNCRPIGRRCYEEDASLTGPAKIAITYSQPHARGRKIVGGLIPTDTVWRFGANIATTLHTDMNITVGTQALPMGDFTLFLLHQKSGAWQLIVNSQTAQWGTERNAAKDIGRITLTAKEMKDNEETFTIYLVPDSQDPKTGYAALSGVMRIRWGSVELQAPWKVTVP